MLEGSIEAIDLDIAAIVNESFSPAARSAAIAATAREALSDAQMQNTAALGYLPPHTMTVDGARDVPEDRVRPDGTIEYAFSLLADLFGWIMQQLVEHSPVGHDGDVHPGLYRDSHLLFADGQQISADGPIPPASKYVFFNAQPYSRPIERGESPQAPAGVYEAVAALAQQRFGNQAKISFGFITPAEGGIVDWASTPLARNLAQRSRGGRHELHTAWLTRVPAITVVPGLA